MTPEQLTGLACSHLTPMPIGVKSFLLHPDIHADLSRLVAAAKHVGFELHLASGFRSYLQQQAIWNQKWSGQRAVLDDAGAKVNIDTLSDPEKLFAILRWSALPGCSRHHWGTDLDVYCQRSLGAHTLQLEPWEYQSGHQAQFSAWLDNELEQFGFFRPYQTDLGGVNIEPWHLSHRKTAEAALDGLTLTKIESALQQNPISGHNAVLQNLETIYNRFVLRITR